MFGKMRMSHENNITKKSPIVEVITCWSDTDFYAPGMLVHVRGGKGILRETYSENGSNASYMTLMFGNEPLIQFQGNEYYCPTCEKIVRSGYRLEQTESFHVEKLNKPKNEVSLEEVFDEMKPLLGLFPDNYYLLLDTEIYPTDGNGHLFWDFPNEDGCLPGSCLYYSDSRWGKLRPHFTIATQSIKALNNERVKYYMAHGSGRAVAYYMDGYMTALIDGHHKALAAAVEHKKLSAIVIAACGISYSAMEGKRYIGLGEIKLDAQNYDIGDTSGNITERISPMEMDNINAKIPKNVIHVDLSYDMKELAKYYPNADAMLYMDEIGEIEDEWLDCILSGEYDCSREEICCLMKAMGSLKHKRLPELADYFLAYPKNHDFEVLRYIVEALVSLPKTQKLENYLIDMMVEIEDEYPYLAGKIIEYL